MRVLFVSPRMPAAGGKGDQLRGFQFARALAGEHEIEFVTTGAGMKVEGAEAEIRSFATLRVLSAPVPARVLGALGALLRGQPAQVGWMMPGRAWQTVRAVRAHADLVIAMTVRSLRGPLPVPVILDHVDSFSLNMRRRATGPEPRAGPLGRAHRGGAAGPVGAASQPTGWPRSSVTSPDRRARAAARTAAARAREQRGRARDEARGGRARHRRHPHGQHGLSAERRRRRLAERSDRACALAPLVRAPRCGCVGRDAGRLTLDERIQVRADVPDLAAYLGRAKVAIAPLRIGTGTPQQGPRGDGGRNRRRRDARRPSRRSRSPRVPSREAETADALAAEVARLLEDSEAREQLAARADAVVAQHDAAAAARATRAIVATAVAS